MLDENEYRTIGKYEIVGPLGRGSMGMVYKGRDPEIGRLVAIKTLRKILPTNLQSADVTLERFRNEARSAGNLRHPNIITIFEVGRDGETPFIVMDYVDGQGLDSVLEREGRISTPRVLRILHQVAQGIDYAHSRNVVHKDIKPANIFLDAAENVFILDFGIATIAESFEEGIAAGGPALGTPGYMSPEQILSERLDHRTDLFSLAIMAFECFTGQRPFPGKTFTEVIGNILNAKPLSLTQIAPDFPLALEAEFEKALSKDKSQRFSSAHGMIEAFSNALGGMTTGGRGPGRNSAAIKSQSFRPNWEGEAASMTAELPPGVVQSLKGGVSAPSASDALRHRPARVSPSRALRSSEASQQPSVLDEARSSPIQTVTFILGALAVVLAAVLYLMITRRNPDKIQPLAAQQESKVVDANKLESVAAVEEVKSGSSTEVPTTSSNPPVVGLSDKELLGVLLSAQSNEESLLQALKEGSSRNIPKFVDACIKPLQNDSYVVRIEAIKAVSSVGGASAVGILVPMLEDYDPLVRGHAAKALGNLGDRRALEALSERMVSEEIGEVKRAMRVAIDRINSVPSAPNTGQSNQLK